MLLNIAKSFHRRWKIFADFQKGGDFSQIDIGNKLKFYGRDFLIFEEKLAGSIKLHFLVGS